MSGIWLFSCNTNVTRFETYAIRKGWKKRTKLWPIQKMIAHDSRYVVTLCWIASQYKCHYFSTHTFLLHEKLTWEKRRQIKHFCSQIFPFLLRNKQMWIWGKKHAKPIEFRKRTREIKTVAFFCLVLGMPSWNIVCATCSHSSANKRKFERSTLRKSYWMFSIGHPKTKFGKIIFFVENSRYDE